MTLRERIDQWNAKAITLEFDVEKLLKKLAEPEEGDEIIVPLGDD